MKQTYNSIYVKEYYEGYSMGINPFSSSNLVKSNAAIYAGFQSGRSEYERMNGYLPEFRHVLLLIRFSKIFYCWYARNANRYW
jgi:hypothetical protein